MDIAWFRDLVICITGLVITVVVVLFGVLSYLLYLRVRTILNSVQAASTNIQEISSTVKDEIVSPIVHLVALIRGISQGIDMFSKFFRKQEGGKDD